MNQFLVLFFSDKTDSFASQISSPTTRNVNELPIRVTLSCEVKGQRVKKLILLPKSLEELLHVGAKKFDFTPTKILTEEGAEVDDITLIRDGDHLLLG